MSLFRGSVIAIFVATMLLGACTLTPLNQTTSSPNFLVGGDGNKAAADSSSVPSVLASMHVAPADSRIAQQVRNELLFALQGGNDPETVYYIVDLDTKSESQEHSSIAGVRAPTSAQVRIIVTYRLKDKATGKVIAKGERAVITGYDLTPQNFANQRAKRDAENRAARTVARQIYLALAQHVAG